MPTGRSSHRSGSARRVHACSPRRISGAQANTMPSQPHRPDGSPIVLARAWPARDSRPASGQRGRALGLTLSGLCTPPPWQAAARHPGHGTGAAARGPFCRTDLRTGSRRNRPSRRTARSATAPRPFAALAGTHAAARILAATPGRAIAAARTRATTPATATAAAARAAATPAAARAATTRTAAACAAITSAAGGGGAAAVTATRAAAPAEAAAPPRTALGGRTPGGDRTAALTAAARTEHSAASHPGACPGRRTTAPDQRVLEAGARGMARVPQDVSRRGAPPG